jgi:hypothetical protein
VLEQCQVTDIIFDQDSYLAGETMNVTVRVVDGADEPLGGAKVSAAVTRPAQTELSGQATTSTDLIDRTGDYVAAYSNTDLPGQYTFDFSVTDPTGQRFLPCSASASIQVATPTPTQTATPTATVTPTVTATPTVTVTPTPTPRVGVLPENYTTTLCSFLDTTSIDLAAIPDLVSVDLELSYDVRIIQVIDADQTKQGVQVRLGSPFSAADVARNEVDTRAGRIFFKATRQAGPLSISSPTSLIEIDWRPQRVGSSPLTLERLVLTGANNQTINVQPQNGTFTVGFVPNCRVAGAVVLQGRSSSGGIAVANSAGAQTQTQASGSFVVDAENVISLKYPGYLSTAIDLRDELQILSADSKTVYLAEIELAAGDITGDDAIDILDLAYIAAKVGTADTGADLNGDGQVNLLDLTMAAGNYGQKGPLQPWP